MPINQSQVKIVAICDMGFTILLFLVFIARFIYILEEEETGTRKILCLWMGLIFISVCVLLQISVDIQLGLYPLTSIYDNAQTWHILSTASTLSVVVWQLLVFKTYVLCGLVLTLRVAANFIFILRILANANRVDDVDSQYSPSPLSPMPISTQWASSLPVLFGFGSINLDKVSQLLPVENNNTNYTALPTVVECNETGSK